MNKPGKRDKLISEVRPDMTTKYLKAYTWEKRWTGKYSFLSSSYDGLVMTQGTKRYFGISGEKCVIFTRQGNTVGYAPVETWDAFGRYLAKKVEENSDVAKTWIKEWKKYSDLFTRVVEKISIPEKLSFEEYVSLRDAFTAYASYHAALKVILDYLPEALLDDLLPIFSEARFYTEKTYPLAEGFFQTYYASISRKSDYPVDLICSLTKEELTEYSKSSRLPSKDVLAERFSFSAQVFDNESYEILVGEEAIALEQEISSTSEAEEVKGMSAYAGKVKGIARIVLDPSKVTVFERGDILVTGMTRPEYIPLIEKSAGLVTDAGGILSHAAIVAREMKKPCVIGTKIATKVFHDGDMIEVDADQGIVRKL